MSFEIEDWGIMKGVDGKVIGKVGVLEWGCKLLVTEEEGEEDKRVFDFIV